MQHMYVHLYSRLKKYVSVTTNDVVKDLYVYLSLPDVYQIIPSLQM